jgi:hypothetical protein
MNPGSPYDRSLNVPKEMHFIFLMGTLYGDGIQLDAMTRIQSPVLWTKIEIEIELTA